MKKIYSYTVKEYDEETGLYYLNARMYDPVIARFMQEDTYRGDPNDPLSLNLYTYVVNNPLVYYDPTGHWPEWLNPVNIWNNTKEGFELVFLSSKEEREEAFEIIDEYGSEFDKFLAKASYWTAIGSATGIGIATGAYVVTIVAPAVAPAVVPTATAWGTAIATSPDTQQDIDFMTLSLAEGDYFGAGLDGVGFLTPWLTGLGQGKRSVKKILPESVNWLKNFFNKSDDIVRNVNKLDDTVRVPVEVLQNADNAKYIDEGLEAVGKVGKDVDFNKRLRGLIGDPPSGMVDPHAHHILFKEGHGEAQKALVKEGQELLRRYNIDPIMGVENLVWAPNRVKGQHGIEALQNVVDNLKQVEKSGGDYDDIVEMLKILGDVAARRR